MAYIDKYGVEFSDDRKTLVRCQEEFRGEYIIPDGVTSIGERAFSCCERLSSVTIPDSVTSIAETFSLCDKLTSIDVSQNNPNYCSIDGVLFNKDKTILIMYPCGKQGAYTIPNSVTNIGNYAFEFCHGLTSIAIPNSVKSIGYKAFHDCHNIASLTIPNSVTNIGNYAFESCHGLTSIAIPNGVINIGEKVFSSCDKLKSVKIPQSVTSIEKRAFENSGLTWIDIAPNNPNYCSIDGVLFNKDKTILLQYPPSKQGAYTIPNSVINIDSAFVTCWRLTAVTIPYSIKSIGDEAFYGCPNLKSVTIPNSVTSIGSGAFSQCESLTSVIIPNSVTSIGERAFERCVELTSVTIPNSVTSIGDNAFYGCTELASVTIPNSVKSIGKYAFFACSSLKTIIIPDSVTSIGEGAFFGLTFIDIAPNNPNYCSVDGVLFNKDKTILLQYPPSKQGAYTIPNSVINIGDSAFCYCTDLTSVTIGNNVTSIKNNAFLCCSSLSEIIVPSGQEERFCEMDGLKNYADIIRKTSEKRRFLIEEQEQQRMMEQQMQEMLQGSFLFFDTETTGTPRNYRAPVSDSDNWPRLVQLAWVMADSEGNILKNKSVIIKPNGFSIPSDASVVHGITTEQAVHEGKALADVLAEFNTDLSFATQVVGHNIDFDQRIVGAEFYRLNMDYDALMNKPSVCTMKSSTDFCAIPNPNPYFGGYKWPSLSELHRKLFGCDFSGAHDALADITATKDCFFELMRRGIINTRY